MLEVRELSVRYGAVEAVRGIDVSVGSGEVVALLGPNGAGKTSMLRASTGLVRYSGSITFEGAEVSKLGPEGCAKRGLIHVPEGRHVFPSLDVHENLQLGTTAAAGRSEGFTIDDVYDLFTPLQDLRHRDGWALSGGEQQMVAIGRALVAKPRMLLLDEPSLGLSPKFVAVVYRALAQVADRIPMLLVEQNTVIALRHCSRAAVMVGGRIVLEGAADELADREALVASYLGEEPALERDQARPQGGRVS